MRPEPACNGCGNHPGVGFNKCGAAGGGGFQLDSSWRGGPPELSSALVAAFFETSGRPKHGRGGRGEFDFQLRFLGVDLGLLAGDPPWLAVVGPIGLVQLRLGSGDVAEIFRDLDSATPWPQRRVRHHHDAPDAAGDCRRDGAPIRGFSVAYVAMRLRMGPAPS